MIHAPKFRILFFLGVAALAAAFAPGQALSHSLFIQSARYHVHEGKRSPLFFCYGHHVPVDDGVRAAKLKFIKVRAPSGEIRNIAVRNETCLHSYMVRYDAPGTWALFAETNPGYYTVYIDKKGRERGTIKSKAEIAGKASKIVKSLYSKQYAKTYVTCDAPSADFPARLGMPLELVPARDVSTLKPGDVLELKIHFKGEPYTGQGEWDATYTGFSTRSEDNYHPRTTVSGDTLRIPIPCSGRWFVRYFIKLDATGADLEKYTRMKHTTTLVFEIPNERKRPKPASH